MDKPRVVCSVPKEVDSLKYLIVEHWKVGPIQIVKPFLDSHNLGAFLLGIDGPHPILPTETQAIVKGFATKGVSVEVRNSFPWIPAIEVQKLVQGEWFTGEGDAILFTAERTLPIQPQALPTLEGFNKDRLSAGSIEFLDNVLRGDAVYVQDDFTESLMVTKSESVLARILSVIAEIEAQGRAGPST